VVANYYGVGLFAPTDYLTTILLFKLLCIAGLEIIALFYIDWLFKHDRNNEYLEKVTPSYTPEKTPLTKIIIVAKYSIRQYSRRIKLIFHKLIPA
jgi:hypothetical protein